MTEERDFQLEERMREEWMAQKDISIKFAKLKLKDFEQLLEFLHIKYGNYRLADWVVWWLRDMNEQEAKIGSGVISSKTLQAIRDEEDEKSFEYRTETGEFEFSGLQNYLNENIRHLKRLQDEILGFISANQEYQRQLESKQEQFNGNYLATAFMPLEHGQKLLQKLNEMEFDFKTAFDLSPERKRGNNTKRAVITGISIQLSPQNFEQIIYHNFMERLNEQHQFITCTQCKKVILDPSAQQLGKYRKTGTATHLHCRSLYNSKQSTKRKQRARQKEKKAVEDDKNS